MEVCEGVWVGGRYWTLRARFAVLVVRIREARPPGLHGCVHAGLWPTRSRSLDLACGPVRTGWGSDAGSRLEAAVDGARAGRIPICLDFRLSCVLERSRRPGPG